MDKQDICCLFCNFTASLNSQLDAHIEEVHPVMFAPDSGNQLLFQEGERFTFQDLDQPMISQNLGTFNVQENWVESLPAFNNNPKESKKRMRNQTTLTPKKLKTNTISETAVNKNMASAVGSNSGANRSEFTLSVINPLENTSEMVSQSENTSIVVIQSQKTIDDYQAENVKLQIRSSALAHDKDRLHQENFNLRMQVFEHQKQTEQRLEELNSAKKNMARMLQVLHTKAVELSTMRLNEERLLLDNAKLRRVLKAKQGNEDLLECVKDTLKEVLEKDNEFCKNMTDTEPSALTYKDSIEIINFIIVDYVAGKQEHVQEVKRLNFQVRGYIEKIGSFKQNIVDLVMKIQSQGAAIKSQNEHNSELKKELDGVKNHLKELGHKLKARDDKIVQLKIAVDKEKNEKLPQTHQLKDQTEEEKRHSEISNKKEELEQNEMMPVSVIVEEMKMKMAKQEADYFASIQKYISNLDAMKTKVQCSFKEKDSQIILLSQQLESSWTTLASVKKELNVKTALLDKLAGEKDICSELVKPQDDNMLVLERLENEIGDILNSTSSMSYEANLAKLKAEIMGSGDMNSNANSSNDTKENNFDVNFSIANLT